MKKIIMKAKVLAITAIVLVAASCEKDHGSLYQGDQSGQGGTISGASGKQVVTVYRLSLEKSYSSYSLHNTYGYAGGTKLTWSGNNLKGMTWIDYEGGVWVNDDDVSFTYDGDRPTEIKVVEDGHSSTYYITYTDGNPTEIYYVVDEEGYWQKTNYEYGADNKIITATRTSSSGSVYSENITWTGDNVTAVKEYDNGILRYSYSYTYDSKKSPNNIIAPLSLKLIMGDYTSLSANNVILEQYQYTYDTYSSESTYSYAYTYDGDYPVKCVRARQNNYDSNGNKTESSTTTYYEYADGTGTSQLPKLYEIVDGGNQDDGYVLGDGVYAAGTEAVLYAYAYYQHQFLRWSDGVTDNPRHITVNSNATYTPIYSSNILLSENFDSGIPSTWEAIDVDGDGNTWYGYMQNYGHNGSVGCARSDSYNGSGALTPTNELFTPYLDVPASGAYLTWYVAAQDAEWPSEYYKVYVGVNGNYTQVYSETVTAKDKTQGTWRYRYVSLNNYANKHIDIMFEHTNCTDQFALCIDDVEVVANSDKGNAKMKTKKMRKRGSLHLPWRTNNEEDIINQQQIIIKNQQQ